MSGEFITPSLYSQTIGDIVVIVDTSGSTRSVIPAFVDELNSLLTKFDGAITLLCSDTKVHSEEQFSSQNLPVEVKVTGGGGTSFAQSFSYIRDKGIQPEAIVYLTDLIIKPDGFGEDPGCPTLWIKANPFGAAFKSAIPPFGRVVNMMD
jgi:predicted metal-dependent peptidase